MLNKKEVYEKLEADFLIENSLEEVTNIKIETTNYNLDEIDLENEEIWMLQCPKGTNLSTMIGQKLKFPGRTNLQQFEVVTTNLQEKKQEAFGYYKQKERSGVRHLLIKGNIVVRKPLKVNDDITAEQIEASCEHAGRPNMPEFVRIRHPLFGQAYKKELKLKQEIEERLIEADKSSLKITGDARHQIMGSKSKKSLKHVNTLVKEKKRKAVKRENSDKNEVTLVKRLKNEKLIKDDVADDLQWLKNV